jgi:hypothetical protein
VKSHKELRKELDDVLIKYIRRFEKKYELSNEWSRGDDLLNVLCFGDYFFGMDDVIYSVENNVHIDVLFNWYDETLLRGMKEEQVINLSSYNKGLRYKDLKKC